MCMGILIGLYVYRISLNVLGRRGRRWRRIILKWVFAKWIVKLWTRLA